MAEPIPDSSSAPAYRPISALAITGFVLATIFTGICLFGSLASLRLGVPFFLPLGTLLIAVAGAVVSYLAINQIKAAYETRAGMTLARWGLWLSLFSGLGYFTYHVFTGLALTQQANAFLLTSGPDSGFFQHIIAGASDPVEFNRAFLLSIPATSREGAHPDRVGEMQFQFNQPSTNSPGSIFKFWHSDVVGLLTRTSGTKVVGSRHIKMEPMGVRDWLYEKNHYVVLRTYRVTTLEGVFDALFTVESTEGSSGEGRKWFLNTYASDIKELQLTKTGETIAYLRQTTRALAQLWFRDITLNRADTRDQGAEKTDWGSLGIEPELQKHLQQKVASLFDSTRPDMPGLEIFEREASSPWQVLDGGNLRMSHSFRWTMADPNATGGGVRSGYVVFGHLTMESDAPVDLKEPGVPVRWIVRGIAIDHIMKQS